VGLSDWPGVRNARTEALDERGSACWPAKGNKHVPQLLQTLERLRRWGVVCEVGGVGNDPSCGLPDEFGVDPRLLLAELRDDAACELFYLWSAKPSGTSLAPSWKP